MDPGRRETPGKVLKERRSPRQRGRMGTSVQNAPEQNAVTITSWLRRYHTGTEIENISKIMFGR